MIEYNNLEIQFKWIILSAKDENKLLKIEKMILKANKFIPDILKVLIYEQRKHIQLNIF
jgi:hypothetical protein